MSFSADEQDERSLRYAGWRVALAASGCVFVSFASLLVFTFSVFLKPLTREFGWSRESASLAFAIAAMTVAVCSPPLGFLLDRYPARRIMLPCIVIFGCAFASLSLLTPHLWHLYAVFFVLGAVGNGTAQLASSRAVTTWFHERRGVALAVLMTGGSIGVMIWPPLTQALIVDIGNIQAPDVAALQKVIKGRFNSSSGNMHMKVSPNWDLGAVVRYVNNGLGYKGLYSIEVPPPQIRGVYDTILANI